MSLVRLWYTAVCDVLRDATEVSSAGNDCSVQLGAAGPGGLRPWEQETLQVTLKCNWPNLPCTFCIFLYQISNIR